MKGYVIDLETMTQENNKFRRVLYTAKNSQLVLMSLLNDAEYVLGDGYAVVVPAGTKHNIINTSDREEMKLYTVYSPPEHQDGVIRATKAEAEAQEEHFDGKITE